MDDGGDELEGGVNQGVSNRGSKRGPGRSGNAGQPIDMGLLPNLIGFNLRCAQLTLFQHFNYTVGKDTISPPQFGTLLLIEANPGLSQSAVAEALRFDRSTLVQIIDRLESKNLVVREVSARDRRSHALRLTEQGQAVLEDLKKATQKHEVEIMRGMTQEEKAELIRLLTILHSPQG